MTQSFVEEQGQPLTQQYAVGVIASNVERAESFCDSAVFQLFISPTLQQLIATDNSDVIRLLVIDHSGNEDWRGAYYSEIRDYYSPLGIPVVLMINEEISLASRIDTIEAGFSDVIYVNDSLDHISARFMSEIYHQIADAQLKNTIRRANDAAFSAMKESSNLGQNIQFFLKNNGCDDLSQLGQVFFQTISEYGLHCSLQMRSEFGVHNMTANGMPRALESELLSKLHGHGRYFDLGRRSIVNYGTVSVLIRNMPEDENLYGLIKDNTFTLMQGLDARVRSLDEHLQLEHEKDALEHLSKSVASVMKDIENDFHSVMLRIVDVVETMVSNIEARIPLLLLNEEQEEYILNTVSCCLQDSSKVFTEGLHIDEHFGGMIKEIEETLLKSEMVASAQIEVKQKMEVEKIVGSEVELF